MRDCNVKTIQMKKLPPLKVKKVQISKTSLQERKRALVEVFDLLFAQNFKQGVSKKEQSSKSKGREKP